MSGYTNVLDVQHTLNRILFTATPFNYSAANTYADNTINVQDIVCTVNIIMGNEDLNATARSLILDGESLRRAAAQPQANLFVNEGRVNISSLVPVGALDIELKGVSTQQVSLLLNHRQYQMIGRNTAEGSRYVIYSPVGQAIPADDVQALLKVSGTAEILAAQVSDMDAAELPIAIGDTPTGIRQLANGTLAARFDGNQLLLTATKTMNDVTVRITGIGGATVLTARLAEIARGETAVPAQLQPGVYVLEVSAANGKRQVVKLMKR
jgi:hypothetical protein